ncbi:glutathione S-transferase family protein [Sinisalibacter aestuarii]|uniref:Glutathione S-transferase n=1 Tax=Sinisalibacter aestuarii TaxID=2949426 RepID=A0ABQ5LP94_9RHOB|nr:glutathione S-transferase family protein [Sinisalibacter aestuarii]GKY86761.1 glutathione S-transferase [Sinisalibacter aestuarii]
MYQVYGNLDTRTFRVLWMLEELGAGYSHIKAAPHSDEARAVNPAGKVPVLIADGVALTDSVAIMSFLADRHGQFTYPCGSTERARQDGFTHFINDELDAALWTAARHSFVLPDDKRVPAVKASLKWEFERSVNELMRRMGEGPFLMGDEMTLPDILAAHCGNWAFGAKFPLTNEAFNAYVKRMRSRAAFKRVRALA